MKNSRWIWSSNSWRNTRHGPSADALWACTRDSLKNTQHIEHFIFEYTYTSELKCVVLCTFVCYLHLNKEYRLVKDFIYYLFLGGYYLSPYFARLQG